MIECPQTCYPLPVAGRAKWLSFHAMDRYRERFNKKTQHTNTVLCHLAWMLSDAVEMELKKRFLVLEMIDHGEHARYWRHGNLMFVVRGDIVVTVHNAAAEHRWKFKKTKTT